MTHLSFFFFFPFLLNLLLRSERKACVQPHVGFSFLHQLLLLCYLCHVSDQSSAGGPQALRVFFFLFLFSYKI